MNRPDRPTRTHAPGMRGPRCGIRQVSPVVYSAEPTCGNCRQCAARQALVSRLEAKGKIARRP